MAALDSTHDQRCQGGLAGCIDRQSGVEARKVQGHRRCCPTRHDHRESPSLPAEPVIQIGYGAEPAGVNEGNAAEIHDDRNRLRGGARQHGSKVGDASEIEFPLRVDDDGL